MALSSLSTETPWSYWLEFNQSILTWNGKAFAASNRDSSEDHKPQNPRNFHCSNYSASPAVWAVNNKMTQVLHNKLTTVIISLVKPKNAKSQLMTCVWEGMLLSQQLKCVLGTTKTHSVSQSFQFRAYVLVAEQFHWDWLFNRSVVLTFLQLGSLGPSHICMVLSHQGAIYCHARIEELYRSYRAMHHLKYRTKTNQKKDREIGNIKESHS